MKCEKSSVVMILGFLKAAKRYKLNDLSGQDFMTLINPPGLAVVSEIHARGTMKILSLQLFSNE